ncbi:MAG: dienelactone hydrolase family protein [Gemmatimonadota bacterium]
MRGTAHVEEKAVHVTADDLDLNADLAIPSDAKGLVLFAHGSGSGRKSPRNRFVAGELNDAGLATLLLDLLTRDEERIDVQTAHLRFDIGMLAERLAKATDWARDQKEIGKLPIGYFGASTGAAAALVAAAERPDDVSAVVSRGGRPDLAGAALPRVRAPTLLLVGQRDEPVIEMNRTARAQLTCRTELVIVPGATHLFEEPGTLEQVAELARDWLLHNAASK